MYKKSLTIVQIIPILEYVALSGIRIVARLAAVKLFRGEYL